MDEDLQGQPPVVAPEPVQPDPAADQPEVVYGVEPEPPEPEFVGVRLIDPTTDHFIYTYREYDAAVGDEVNKEVTISRAGTQVHPDLVEAAQEAARGVGLTIVED